MFWSLNYGGSSIDSILDRAGFTLEELLDEDELLQECKTQNSKLIEFLTQPESLARLISYIVEMPTEADSTQRRYKYPFVSSEVLSCDVAAVRGARRRARQPQIRRHREDGNVGRLGARQYEWWWWSCWRR